MTADLHLSKLQKQPDFSGSAPTFQPKCEHLSVTTLMRLIDDTSALFVGALQDPVTPGPVAQGCHKRTLRPSLQSHCQGDPQRQHVLTRSTAMHQRASWLFFHLGGAASLLKCR